MNLSGHGKTGHIFCLIAGLSLCGVTAAEKTTPAQTAEEEPAYVTADRMTRDDRKMLAEYSNRYDNCLGETSVRQMQVQDDPRHVVDYAMKECAVELENLNMEMTARNFDPDFRRGYIRRINTRAVSNTLRLVMMGLAARQSRSAPVE